LGEQGLCVKALYAEGDAVVLQAQRGEDVQGEVVRVVFRQGEVVVVRGDAAVGVDVFPAVRPLDGDVGDMGVSVLLGGVG